ncbi:MULTISPECIES: trypsin-like peptidase domain-containing protein [unclassified Oceanobacter]|uniref:trypsin-like peptidase domain-containing protein n=1 Tax=unclassified Oceanobacter TaxID=2620260 RepID=UPI002733D71C|nr:MULTISPECIES: trypsin-like peptidase domain-containing protein [unclassified Oceanobacter]MDP2607851.1 trypsin-like peptidase domain-containing protein [Oceanobacter sp. 1_MG-2023]MDP2610965.1 trypsin-like peptidase domain-containing protein [Oceanobacter sp. 2_MG-2023]
MRELVVGANEGLPVTDIRLTLDSKQVGALGRNAGLALLPLDAKHLPTGAPSLYRLTQPWMQWHEEGDSLRCEVDLAQLPARSDRLLLVVYTFAAVGPVAELERVHLRIADIISYKLELQDSGDAAMVIGECYRRGAQWKFRALAEGSAYGLAAFGRRLGLTIDDHHPDRSHEAAGAEAGRAAAGVATGTGFAVSSRHILTCAHVIEDRQDIHITSFDGRYRAEPVMVDRRNDIALLRIQQEPGLQPVCFRDDVRCHLGETVVALGFPLAGFAGGDVHVTQGGISALFGVHNDASILQFTAPIQPGSSGSPLFDSNGAVVGMVTSSISDAQNMNFAVKAALLQAFLHACRVEVSTMTSATTLTTADMARVTQPSLWKIEARGS